MTATETALEQASTGLTYQSESDAPWEVVSWSSATGEVTADAVKKLGKHRTGTVTEQSVDEFFKPLTENLDWYGDEEKAIAQQYQVLLATIKANLTNPKVVKITAKTKATVYVVGQAKEGGWVGLKTEAVET
ncbi:MAG: nuclease A inhibitor family protein [Planctomycetes bacterium]|nr:nuclease A inhibitor family protein [Planctomycetota bacterium]